ncbi:hypothetical protein GCM10010399_81140 [Dactylosporangium fulvum]|uniref:THIF-type NAD/FAD binding fold domain-containing protein n=1 Tax=Dactylosporangium fulvum TaxID=53359 RepID=A0ABY5VQM2_9ACTN|nr:hypothetical protein [Dactylosporangium fulvum]UWP79356.1 hypothetical protein Dfulv_29835 [Dactylosporangium fulvum]
MTSDYGCVLRPARDPWAWYVPSRVFVPSRVLVAGVGAIGWPAALLGVQRGLGVHALDRVTSSSAPFRG